MHIMEYYLFIYLFYCGCYGILLFIVKQLIVHYKATHGHLMATHCIATHGHRIETHCIATYGHCIETHGHSKATYGHCKATINHIF